MLQMVIETISSDKQKIAEKNNHAFYFVKQFSMCISTKLDKTRIMIESM